MADEKKTDGEVEENKPTTAQSPEQQKTPEKQTPSSSSAIEQEEQRLQSAVAHVIERATEKLNVSELSGLPEAMLLTYRGETGTAKWFRRLPVSMSTADLSPETPRWKVELIGLGSTTEPLGIEIVGDTVVGRGRVGTEPADLDLDAYNALDKGVSRRHSLLRPTTNHLYIIDLGSTNGTFHNGIPLGPGVARALKHNDTLTLGRLSFTLKLIDGPTIHRTSEPESATVANVEEKEKTKPLEPLDASTLKEKKARLAPPSLGQASPETTKLTDDAAAKQLPIGEAKPLAQAPSVEAKPSTMDAKPSVTEVKPSATEAQSSTLEAKPSDADTKQPVEAARPPVPEVKPIKEVTRPFDPDTQPMMARSPLTEAKPLVPEGKPTAEEKPEEKKSEPDKGDDAAKSR